MPTRKILLPSPNTVAASSTSLIQCPVGPAYRYRAIHLKIGVLSGGTAVAATAVPTSYVGDIRVKCNGRTQRLHTASQMARLNRLNGTAYVESTWGAAVAADKYGQVLTIWFAEPWRKQVGQTEALALPSSQLNTLEVEVDFNALPTNAASFNLVAYAEVDGEAGSSLHANGVVLSKVFRQNLTGGTAANSALDITTLDRRDLYTTIVAELGNSAAPGTAANGITVSADADLTAKLVVTANANTIHELPKAVAALVHSASGLNPSQFDLEAVLDSSDDIRSGLTANGLSDLRVRVDVGSDTAASASWVLLTERTGPLD
jgi:hypothetical protein